MALTQERRENLTKLAAMKEGWGSAKDSDMKRFLRKEVAPRTTMASNRLKNARKALAGRSFKNADSSGTSFKEMLGLGKGVGKMTSAGSKKAADKKMLGVMASRILGLESKRSGNGGRQMEGKSGMNMAGLGGNQTAIKRSERRGGRQSEKTIGRSPVGDGGGRQMENKLRKSMKRMSYARK